MKKQLMFLLLWGLFSLWGLDHLVAQKPYDEYKNSSVYGLEYFFKLGILDDTLCHSNSTGTALEISNRVKQFEKDYSPTTNPVDLAAYFCADAEMIDPEGQKYHGAYAIGLSQSANIQITTYHFSMDVDEVMVLTNDQTFSLSHYLIKTSLKSDGFPLETQGIALSLWRKEAGEWKILRHILMHKIP